MLAAVDSIPFAFRVTFHRLQNIHGFLPMTYLMRRLIYARFDVAILPYSGCLK